MVKESPLHDEMPMKSQDRSGMQLIDTANSTTDDAHGELHLQPWSSKTRELLRLFKLQLFGQFTAWKAPIERPKVAIHQNRSIAAFHALIHIVPLGGAIALLVLNWTSFFVGPGFSTATDLQFAAKLHEILMQTSIVEVILSIIRTQVVAGYIPLGALSAFLQAFQLSYIWSLDFVSTVTSSAFHGRNKVFFATTILLLMVLNTLVGPSGAVLMIPRVGLSRTFDSQRLFANVSEATMFPSHVNSKYDMNFNPEHFLNAYSQIMQLDTVQVDSQTTVNTDSIYMQRALHLSTRNRAIPVAGHVDNGYRYSTTATIPTQLAVLNLFEGSFATSQYPNATVSIDVPHPLVVVRCASPIIPETADSTVPYIQQDGVQEGLLANVGELLKPYTEQGGSNETMIDSVPPVWLASPDSNSSLVGTFLKYNFESCDHSNSSSSYPVSDMFTEEYKNATRSCTSITSCTISAFWETSKNEVTHISGARIAQTGKFVDEGFRKVDYRNPITMDLTGISSFNDANFSRLLTDPLEMNVAAIFVTVLANVTSMNTLEPDNPPSKDFPSYNLNAIQYGYGYDTSATSVRLSLAVITTYCLVTIVYLLYILITGHTSTAWNSVVELVLLALQSQRPDHLPNTSVGVETMETYREQVGIRVNNREELELVFASDRDFDTRELRKIVRNKAY